MHRATANISSMGKASSYHCNALNNSVVARMCSMSSCLTTSPKYLNHVVILRPYLIAATKCKPPLDRSIPSPANAMHIRRLKPRHVQMRSGVPGLLRSAEEACSYLRDTISNIPGSSSILIWPKPLVSCSTNTIKVLNIGSLTTSHYGSSHRSTESLGGL
jgi:hypothetical protein